MDGRNELYRRSARPLLYLHLLPRWVPFVLVLALFLTGLFAGGLAGAVALLALAALVAWLAAVSWPRNPPARRALALLVVAVLAALAASKLR